MYKIIAAAENRLEGLDSIDFPKAAYRATLNMFTTLVDQVNRSSTASYPGAPAFSLFKRMTDKQNLLNTLVQKLQAFKFSPNPIFDHQRLFSTVISKLINEDDKVVISLSLVYPSVRNWHKEPELNPEVLADWDEARRHNSSSPLLKLPIEMLTRIFTFLEHKQQLASTSIKLRKARGELPLALTLRKSELNTIDGFFETKFSKLQAFCSDSQNLAQIPAERLGYFLRLHPMITSLSFRESSLTTDQLMTILRTAKDLSSIDLSGNDLSSISADMWKTFFDNNPNLKRLTLQSCGLTVIPPMLEQLTQLTDLNLSYNELSGSIPPSLGNLTQLRRLNLSDNALSGNIPDALGNLTQLTDLNLRYNELSGEIPPSLGNLTQLTVLNISDNQLLGDIPASLRQLTKLTVLNLGVNGLTGPIPPCLGQLTQLTTLYLRNNQLLGDIPDALGDLTQLTVLDISDNLLTGAIPTELGQLTKLTVLNLGDNALEEAIPTELGRLTKLTVLNLGDNVLEGAIPTELGRLTKLTVLNLDGNALDPIPNLVLFSMRTSHLFPGD